ncbi:Solute carrier family 22 member 18 [Heterocephalus glaber]|uniref:Solute carrier family 22 member 18 n=1 Tax=Heterocephalus glaber TaxID=10181 RepID=G5BST7_HETGA|nr:solute carrier family 22 member 18 isoform X1 [Heterocephalus glaber]XP_004852172.1 solute carrier family 22 member 18 isoform X1 [Heterocephalus glaber]XP_004852173.1 solute carrier family 22 member 18 isoform X1 [Heterocephalus glaber]XP_004852174.1 solute carrier family 22 member 18 isoform X1 [Heterocephalus glaber]XP_004852175.1 solute carrier family 22 member 18 isoform X1 [Heterocephalus glaber]EHB12348.1 Solute carrier family 22 member 18 [Heterocephalus glaber]
MQGASAHRTHQSLRTMGTLARPRVILLTYLLAAMELTCLFMQFSILPYLSRRLGLDSVAYGYLQTTFGVLQLLGGPVFGRFADQRGARAALSLSFLAASVFYLLLAAACSPALPGVLLLFASRLPSPFMHTLPAAQMIITDLTGPEERPAALGRLGLCFGVGIILGSLLGGTLSTSCGIHCPAIAAFMANLLGAVISFTCIPAKTKEASVDAQATQPGLPKASVFDLKAITRLLLLPSVLPVFLVKVASGFPSGLFMVMFSIISMDFFQLEASQAGYLMSFFGILQMVTQGLVIGRLSRHFSEEALLRASVLVFIMVGLGMVLMSNILHFCFLMPGLVFSLCSLNVVTDSMLTKAVSATDTGTMLGLCASVQPLTRTVGPTIGGLLYRNFGVPIFGHVQLAVNFLIFLFLWRKPMSQKGDKAK